MGQSSFQDWDGRFFVVESIQGGLHALAAVPVSCASGAEVALAGAVSQMIAWGAAVMAKTAKPAVEVNGSQWTRFVEIPLGSFTKADVSDRYGTWEDFELELGSLVKSGYRVAVSYTEANHSFVASVTCRADGDPNQGCTFTAFAGDWFTALQVACFKHFVVAEGVWSRFIGSPAGDGIG